MEKIEIVIATNNENKVKEFREIFSNFPVHITSLKEEGINSQPDENGKTFLDNAMIKAKAVANLTKKVVIADDSGLCIECLNDFPGIYSSRFMEGCSYQEKNKKILEMVKDKTNRKASFYCAIVVYNFFDEPVSFIGRSEGIIVEAVYTSSGFGYDPIFFSNTAQKRFSEMSLEEKNKISHRGKAVSNLLSFMRENYQKYLHLKSEK